MRSRPICVFIALAASGRSSVTTRMCGSRRSTESVSKLLRMRLSLRLFPLRVVLAQLRRVTLRARALRVERDRNARQRKLVALDGREQAERGGLRMRGDLVGSEERRVRYPGPVERGHQVFDLVRGDLLRDLGYQLLAVHDA